MEAIKRRLSNKLEEYVAIILDEYQDYIPPERQAFLKSITDFSKCIEISDTGTITLYYHNNKIYFPIIAFPILESFKNNPKYKSNPNHKCYSDLTLIKNNNTFIDYINHVITAGLTAEEFFHEGLLHETMHFCGIRGADPLREGLTELKTRELAKKRGLTTTACGYPKEIEIVLRLQEIFGEDIINKISFSKTNNDISELLISECGSEAEKLYFEVLNEMNEMFIQYIRTPYNGPDAPMKKAAAYDKIDYTFAHHLIDEYQSKNEIKNMIGQSINKESQERKNNGIKN